MEPIIRTILDSDLPAVRKIISEDAGAAWQKSETGKTPIQVAFAAGNYPICAALLKHTPQCLDEIPITVSDLLEQLIRDFSQSTLCSSWNQNIEYDLWALVTHDPDYKRGYDRDLKADPDSLSEIGWIARWAEGWFHWPDSEGFPIFVAEDEWEQRYRKHKIR